jgi:hypothetical protein
MKIINLQKKSDRKKYCVKNKKKCVKCNCIIWSNPKEKKEKPDEARK